MEFLPARPEMLSGRYINYCYLFNGIFSFRRPISGKIDRKRAAYSEAHKLKNSIKLGLRTQPELKHFHKVCLDLDTCACTGVMFVNLRSSECLFY